MTNDNLLQVKLRIWASKPDVRDEFCIYEQARLENLIRGVNEPILTERGCNQCTGISYVPPFKCDCNFYYKLSYENALKELKTRGVTLK